MILTGDEINKAVIAGDIVIEPYDPSNLNPNSYNFSLGSGVKTAEGAGFDAGTSPRFRSGRIPQCGLILSPGKLYLASTHERIGSHKYVTTLLGRSSVGRLGLYLQAAADLGHVGSAHCWTLELSVVQPLRIYGELSVGQVCFWETAGAADLYTGFYGSQDEPTGPRLESLWL